MWKKIGVMGIMLTVNATLMVAVPMVATVSDGAKQLPSSFYGYNTDAYLADHAGIIGDKTLTMQVKKLNGPILRYPGGTLSNYWDWQSGWYVQQGLPDNMSWALKRTPVVPYNLGMFSQLIKESGAVPLFDLNVMTSTLSSQMAMLKRAQELGLSTNYIELGNEFYLNRPDYQAKFPSSQSYMTQMQPWVKAVHQQFPNSKIAVVADANIGGSNDNNSWNSNLQNIGEDALTMHLYFDMNPYFNINSLVNTHTIDSQQGALLLGLPFIQYSNFTSALSTLPSGVRTLPVWITEYNMVSGGAYQQNPNNGYYNSWAQGLSNSTLAILLSENPQVQMLLLHCLVANNGCYSALQPSDPYTFASTGAALSLIENASSGMNLVTPLNFTNDYSIISLGGTSESVPSYPMVLGALFENGTGAKNSIVINLTSGWESVDMSSINAKGSYIQYFDELGTQFENQATPKTRQGSLNNGILELPPYSVSLVKGE